MSGSTDERGASPAGGLRRRLFWLAVCAAVGLLAGAVGSAWSDNEWWWLAIPAALAVGWLYFSDPTACVAPRTLPERTGTSGDSDA